MSVFDAVLPTTTPIQRAETSKERVQALVAGKKTARASGLFRVLGCMLYNGDEILAARKADREAREKAAAAKAKKAEDKEIKLYEEASLMYQLFVDEKNRDLQKMKKDELSPIVKYLCSVNPQGRGDCVTKYKKKPEMIARIMNVGSQPWTFWFDTQAEEEAEGAVETPPAEAEEGLDGEAGST